ncbi:nucleotidyltransferase family protein [Gammaproteobacteria bacterium AH-315-E17]|nr:nucleotidyltransferase family protein [bacterium AH-315-I11]MBN4074971.1 nucleotidyltransferase family protein [Gammaproteobacteria bacterium AH-315-E17]
MKVMILAAGKGERMRPLTEKVPKPLLPVGGKPLIEYLIESLNQAGFTDLVINHAWLGEQIEAALGDGSCFGSKIVYSAEGEPLNTAGGIIKALPLLGDSPFVLVNGDIWTDYSFSALKAYSNMEQLAHLVMVANPLQHPKGDYVLGSNGYLALSDRLQSIQESLTYSGIAVLHPKLFENIAVEKLPLATLYASAIKQKRVSAEYYEGEWSDIGTLDRLKELDAHLQQIETSKEI